MRLSVGAEIARRARALVGTPFRPQGRRAEQGLDCVGLVAAAAGLPDEMLPADYRLRSEAGAMLPDLRGIADPISLAEARAGDVMLVEAGPRQHHLVILVENGFVHADAGLRRVVETPGAVPWRPLAAWRMKEAR